MHPLFRSNFRYASVFRTMLIAALATAGSAGLVQSQVRPAAPAAPVAPAAKPANLNAVTTALQDAGVKRCVSQIQKVTDFITKQARTGTTAFPLSVKPDEGMVSLSSEITSGNVLSYSGASFAPRNDGCSAVYEQVTYWQNTCDEVYAAQFTAFKPTGVLQQQIKVAMSNLGSRVMLMPAGAGCVVIKKEIIH